MVFFLIYPS